MSHAVPQDHAAAMGMATVGANAALRGGDGIVTSRRLRCSQSVAVPEMMKLNYNPKRFAVGVVAGSSVLGMIIPPSAMLIIYAIVAEQSVGHMFLAGIIPGILLVGGLCGRDLGACRACFTPSFVVNDVGGLPGKTMTSMTRSARLRPDVPADNGGSLVLDRSGRHLHRLDDPGGGRVRRVRPSDCLILAVL